MTDLTEARIRELAHFVRLAALECDEHKADPEVKNLYDDLWTALVELGARRRLADERKKFWAQKRGWA